MLHEARSGSAIEFNTYPTRVCKRVFHLSVALQFYAFVFFSPRIVLKIVGLTCIVSVFLTILTCYFCKRYWKRSDSRDNHVYRVACSTSNTPHVFPLDSFPLNPNAFFKSENRDDTANFCGDISVISAQPTHYRTRAPRPNPSASALCSYQHHSLSRQQRSHEPPPPYQLSVISETARSAPTNRHAAATATDPKSIEVATTPTTANTSQQSAQQNKQVTAAKTDNAETGPKRFVWRRLSH